jgi:hypothetical protein
MTRTEILLVVDSPMEVFPQRVVGDLYHALNQKAWFKGLASLEIGSRDYLKEAKSIADEMYDGPSGEQNRQTLEKLSKRNEELERQVQERTDAFFKVWKECERLRKEINGG